MQTFPFRPRVTGSVVFFFCALCWLCSLLAPAPAHSAIYTWRDSTGRLQISDTPPAPSQKQQNSGQTVPPAYPANKPIKPPQKEKAVKGTGKLFLWQVSSPTTSGYLLGTIHFGTPDMYPVDLRIEEAFESAQVVAMEANPFALNPEASSLVKTLGIYPEGDSLMNHISEKTAEMLRMQGLPLELFARVRPWLLALQLEVAAYQKLGYDAQYGVDYHFFQQLGGRRLVELESVESQIRMLSKIPGGDEDGYLQKTLSLLGEIKNIFPRLVNLWKNGDAQGLEKLVLQSGPELGMDKRTYNIMIRDRNKVMAAGIEKLLQGRQPFIAMVGSLHLVGSDGVPTLLKKQGYQVRQVGAGQASLLFFPLEPKGTASAARNPVPLYGPCSSKRCAI